jgi:hypothetical protein
VARARLAHASRRMRELAAVAFALIAFGLLAWWLNQQMATT